MSLRPKSTLSECPCDLDGNLNVSANISRLKDGNLLDQEQVYQSVYATTFVPDCGVYLIF